MSPQLLQSCAVTGEVNSIAAKRSCHTLVLCLIACPVAGHNGCLQCMATVRRSKSECPLCRQNIPESTELVINRELRDLVSLASALHTVDQDGWEAVTSNKALSKSRKLEAGPDDADVTLVPTAPPVHVSLSTVLQGGGDLLSLEPPTWLPDSHAQECGNCQQTFRCEADCCSCTMKRRPVITVCCHTRHAAVHQMPCQPCCTCTCCYVCMTCVICCIHINASAWVDIPWRQCRF